MADVIDELLRGGVAPEALAAELRRQIEYGTAGSFSGLIRIAPGAAALRKEALATAGGIGATRRRGVERDEDMTLELMGQRLQAAQKDADRKQRASDSAAQRALLEKLQNMRGASAEKIAGMRAQKAGPASATPDELLSQADTFLTLADKAKTAADRAGVFNSGLASLSKIVPGSPARNFDAYLEPLRSNLALSALADLKAKSKTGASGLGSVTEREIDLLMSKISSVDVGQSPAQLRASLQEIQTHYANLAAQVAEAAKRGGSGLDDYNPEYDLGPGSGEDFAEDVE